MRGTRAYKLQEFVAHSDRTNCLQVGRKSSGVLVTGGDDGIVNVWAIGKPAAILSLPGHVTAVTSVCFDDAEECVLAGSYGATLKLFDLEESKVVCTATGHRSSIECVAFHPSGPFFGSGSLDCNFKLWDKRQKGCVATFKGHTKGITQLCFSPDGRWVVTGSEDSTVKLWDLTAGKLLHDFTSHTHPITAVHFNPCEFVLATASADRTTAFHDLDTFERIDACGPETAIPRALCFSPNGTALLAAFHDGLRIYGYEPARTFDVVDAPWGKVADVTICDGRVLGCSLAGAAVSVWVAKLSEIEPFRAGGAADARGVDGIAPPPPPQGRASEGTAAAAAARLSNGALQAAASAADAPNGAPATERNAGRLRAEDGLAEPQPGSIAAVDAGVQSMTIKPKPGMANASTEVGDSLVRGQLQAGDLSRLARAAAQRTPSARRAEPAIEIYEPQPRVAAAAQGPADAAPRLFVRQDSDIDGPPGARGYEATGPDDVLRHLDASHAKFCGQLEARRANMSLIKVFWRQGDVKALMGALRRCSDPGLAADVVKLLKSDGSAFKLDVCPDAAAVVSLCLSSRVEGYSAPAVEFASRLLRGFSQVIRDTTRAGRSGAGVDLSYEDRMRKCYAARDAFQALVPELERVRGGAKAADVRRQAGELLELIRSL